MTTLIYRRTHRGDPDDTKIFGKNDCMRRVRELNFDAVIGVGGTSPDSGEEGIARKINWVGIRPLKIKERHEHKTVRFDQFIRLDEAGPDLKTMAPKLFDYMFRQGRIPRYGLSTNLSKQLVAEIDDVLHWAFDTTQLKGTPVPLASKSGKNLRDCGCGKKTCPSPLPEGC
ncbi:MAG TPA: hypothetical protein VFC39_04275 [Acidobacteriaceae bacterium]|nr:hypothetical protein [Acidobacteriaceae bacterium]